MGHVARRVDVHVSGGGERSRFAEVERARAVVPHANDHEAAPPDVSRDRVDHRQGEPDRYGRVDRVPAAPEDVDSDLARQGMRRDHHRVPPRDGPDAPAEGPLGRLRAAAARSER